jgi:hypothetical protein
MIFNNFLNTYLRIFYSSFTKRKIKSKPKGNAWITTGMQISCINKINFYLQCRTSNDTHLKEPYKQYCKTLTKVINADKKLYFDRRIINSKNKLKTTWNIIRTETGKKESKEDIQYLDIKGNTSSNQQIMANKFNDYFLTIVDNIIDSRVSNPGQPTHDNHLNYMSQTYKGPLPNIHFSHTSAHEIEEIIKSLEAKHSYGYNEIPATILEVSAPFISLP